MIKRQESIISPKLFFGFCTLELLILITLKALQAIYPQSAIEIVPMFSAILLNALFMLFLVIRFKMANKPTAITGIPLAIFVTLLADCFLVLLHGLAKIDRAPFFTPLSANMVGFFIFGLVQVVYACYINLTKRRAIIRIAIYLSLVAAVTAGGIITWDRFIACLSMSQLVLNLIFSWIDYRKRPSKASLLLAVGISLFFGCDLFIMMRMLLPEAGLLYNIICFMVWIFYIPSQVVLTSSYLADRTQK